MDIRKKIAAIYETAKKVLAWPIPFWFSPIGLLVIILLIWSATCFIQPIILVDKHIDLANISGVRIWILDKAFYVLFALFVAYWTQYLLNLNTLKRDSMNAQLGSLRELASEYSELRNRVSETQTISLGELSATFSDIERRYKHLLHKGEVRGVPIESSERSGLFSNAIEFLCDLNEGKSRNIELNKVFKEVYTDQSKFKDFFDTLVCHEPFTSQVKGQARRAFDEVYLVIDNATNYYQESAKSLSNSINS